MHLQLQFSKLNANVPSPATQGSNRISGRFFLILAVAAAVVFPAAKARAEGNVDASDPAAFLRAIAEVETGNNPRKVGSRGERGLYQFRLSTWRRYTKRAFCDAHNRSASKAIAIQHMAWLQTQLERNGRRPTPFLLAAAWNAGVGRVISGHVPAASRDYAQRVTNLTNHFAALMAPHVSWKNNATLLASAQ